MGTNRNTNTIEETRFSFAERCFVALGVTGITVFGTVAVWAFMELARAISTSG